MLKKKHVLENHKNVLLLLFVYLLLFLFMLQKKKKKNNETGYFNEFSLKLSNINNLVVILRILCITLSKHLLSSYISIIKTFHSFEIL